jgi:hypothetical protein
MPSNKLRIDIPDTITTKLEEESQNDGISRQKIVQKILEGYYSPGLELEEGEQKEIDYLRRENKILYEHVELLRGVSAMIMAKQLLPTEEVGKKPRWTTRLKLFLGFKGRG